MVRTLVACVALAVAVGCRPDKDPVGVNQCLRTNIFKLCLELAAKLPNEDTDSPAVVRECDIHAHDQALFRKSAVQPEQCWVPR